MADGGEVSKYQSWTPQDTVEMIDRVGVAMGHLSQLIEAIQKQDRGGVLNNATDAMGLMEELQMRAIEMGALGR